MQVASESQIKFAIENKFDETGPGAKQPEYAYHTYKNLDDALVAYLDDPDTKLPEFDRERAIDKLTQQQQPGRLFQSNGNYKISKPHSQNLQTEVYDLSIGKHFYDQDSKIGKLGVDGNGVTTYKVVDKKVEPIRFQKIHKSVPLSLAHYTRDPSVVDDEFTHPKYSFAYEVHVSIWVLYSAVIKLVTPTEILMVTERLDVAFYELQLHNNFGSHYSL